MFLAFVLFRVCVAVVSSSTCRYPEHSQSDFVKDVGEYDVLSEHLKQMFPTDGPPLPWDTNREYVELSVGRVMPEPYAEPF